MPSESSVPSGSSVPSRTATDALRVLAARRETLGCAESLTGGELAAALSGPAGASASFAGAVVAYATEVKRQLLGVTTEKVVSARCAAEMAHGLRSLLGVDWALATTGVAGPDRQEDLPVGTVYVGLSGPAGERTVRLALEGTRADIRAAACAEAIALLRAELGDG